MLVALKTERFRTMLKFIAPLLATLTIAGGFLVPTAQAAVTADIGSSQGGDHPYTWEISYDDVAKRVTAQGTGTDNDVLVRVQITTSGATSDIAFVQPGDTTTFPTADFRVTFGAGPTLIGPTIQPNTVARIVGKVGTPVGGLPFSETVQRIF